MVSDGARLVNTLPAQQACAPGEIDVGCPALEVCVEDLALDRARLERLAPVERRGAVDSEHLAGQLVRKPRPPVPDERVLAAAVDDHARGVERVEAVARI